MAGVVGGLFESLALLVNGLAGLGLGFAAGAVIFAPKSSSLGRCLVGVVCSLGSLSATLPDFLRTLTRGDFTIRSMFCSILEISVEPGLLTISFVEAAFCGEIFAADGNWPVDSARDCSNLLSLISNPSDTHLALEEIGEQGDCGACL